MYSVACEYIKNIIGYSKDSENNILQTKKV